jgi:ATP-dependent helicase HrpB
MEKLPIYDVLDALRKSLRDHTTVILQAPPGAGKSTVLPLELLNEPFLNGKKILMLEPRRLAAKAVAWRLAEQLNESTGETVGYRVRFEKKVSSKTRIEIVTEGILTRMLQNDNSLESVGLIIFDEFHERSLHADLALALSREIQQILRGDLRILIMSATLDSQELTAALSNPPLITSQGRQYPISLRYVEADSTLSVSQNTCRLVLKALREETGDVLVFLPGSGDIHRAKEILEDAGVSAIIYPLYGDLPYDEQQRAIVPDPNGRRKIILSTSIAETSLTLQGIKIVVDSGYSRVPRFDQNTGLTRLETVRSSKDTADQRAGRAGRLGPGICYRMWAESTHHQLADQRKPEILQADLAQLTLELAGWGHTDPSTLDWVTSPPKSSITLATQLLDNLAAIKDGKITAEGRAILELPTHPRIAHLLLYGKRNGCASTAATVAALLEERDPMRGELSTDLSLRTSLLEKFRKRERVNADRGAIERIEQMARHWRQLLSVKEDDENDPATIGELIAAAYPERIARKENENGRYRMANGRAAKLPDGDPLLHEDWIAIAQLDAGTQEGKIFMAAPFDPSGLIKHLQPTIVVTWDDRQGMLVARKEWRIGNLLAKSEPLPKPDTTLATAAICSFIAREGLHVFNRTEAADQLQARCLSLRKWQPELSLFDFSDENLLNTVDQWAGPFLSNVRKKEDLKKLDLNELLLSALTWDQQQVVNRLAPEKVEVPSGSDIKINYQPDGSAPVLSVRLQEVFGMKESPTVNEGRIKLLLHLLSPGYKPVQVTQDLHSFWQNTYHEVRKELRIRYPKHSWPEDPWTAQAVRGVPRKKPH